MRREDPDVSRPGSYFTGFASSIRDVLSGSM